jgi:hypothetical protein
MNIINTKVTDESFIVRIYRVDAKRHGIIGVVEEIGVKGKKAFTNVDELWEILNRSQGKEPTKEKRVLPDAPFLQGEADPVEPAQ